MRLSTRTALAAFAASTVTLLAIGVLFRVQFEHALRDRVDAQLEQRAETAPILAAIADRLSTSELSATVEGARVLADGELVEIGLLPGDPLPPVVAPGWETVAADGQRWRLHTIAVIDVPRAGDRSLVQMVAPLGDVDAASRRLRRRALLVALIAAAVAGAVGAALGRLASRPLTSLRDDAARLDGSRPDTWSIGRHYGSPEVDDVAAALDDHLRRLADETTRRGAALDAARAFSASATHELRTPLQGALTNLEIAGNVDLAPADRQESLELAHAQLRRMGTSLAAVRALADAEFADPAWFQHVDLSDIVEGVADEERRRHPDVTIDVVGAERAPVVAWADGVQLAVANVVRNAIVHGADGDRAAPHIVVTVGAETVTIDDDGPGIPSADRTRVTGRFVRGGRSSGSGLGLAIVSEVMAAHAGSVTVDVSPSGGARVVLDFGVQPGPLRA
jgi:two-component system sensor histidine kinase PrrB